MVKIRPVVVVGTPDMSDNFRDFMFREYGGYAHEALTFRGDKSFRVFFVDTSVIVESGIIVQHERKGGFIHNYDG